MQIPKSSTLREKSPYLEFSGPHFPAFGLNAERYGGSLRILSECGKIRTRITPNTGTFYAVESLCIKISIPWRY